LVSNHDDVVGDLQSSSPRSLSLRDADTLWIAISTFVRMKVYEAVLKTKVGVLPRGSRDQHTPRRRRRVPSLQRMQRDGGGGWMDGGEGSMGDRRLDSAL